MMKTSRALLCVRRECRDLAESYTLAGVPRADVALPSPFGRAWGHRLAGQCATLSRGSTDKPHFLAISSIVVGPRASFSSLPRRDGVCELAGERRAVFLLTLARGRSGRSAHAQFHTLVHVALDG